MMGANSNKLDETMSSMRMIWTLLSYYDEGMIDDDDDK